MPPQNPITRLETVAAALAALAGELEKVYGEPVPNLVHWHNEIIDVIDDLTTRSAAGSSQARE